MDQRPTPARRIVAEQCHRLGWTFIDWVIVISTVAFLVVFINGGFE